MSALMTSLERAWKIYPSYLQTPTSTPACFSLSSTATRLLSSYRAVSSSSNQRRTTRCKGCKTLSATILLCLFAVRTGLTFSHLMVTGRRAAPGLASKIDLTRSMHSVRAALTRLRRASNRCWTTPMRRVFKRITMFVQRSNKIIKPDPPSWS